MLLTLYKSALRPIEIKALLKIKIRGNTYAPPATALEDLAATLDDRAFCYAALGKVSRSFSVVIQQLPESLKDAVCIFYLVLRALDTVEDDMTIPRDEKVPMLLKFHELTQDPTFSLNGIGDNKDYQALLEYYPKVYRTFEGLSTGARETIVEITRRMGEGMAVFMDKDVKTIKDFDLYCHYVAGLVGIGLTRLFLSYDENSVSLKDPDTVSNSMGLFLQKTNIIRDYHEDLFADRSFWPKEIWGNYADNLEDLAKDPENPETLAAMNAMIVDALRHIPDVLGYLSGVHDEQIFRFTAVPQIMAIATLAKLYNNPEVLKGVVKVRKGLAAKLMIYNVNINDVYRYFKKSMLNIEKKNKPGMPDFEKTKETIDLIYGYLHARMV